MDRAAAEQIFASYLWRALIWRITAFSLLAFCIGSPAAAQVRIDFETAPPTAIIAQFQNLGVTFNGPLLRDFSPTPGFARSGTKTIELCFAQEFCTQPLRIDFTAGQRRVGLWVGIAVPLVEPTRVVMQAFDGNGALIGESSVQFAPSAAPIPVQTPLEIVSGSPDIRRVVVQYAPGPNGQSFNNSLVVDDVEFDTAGTAPACPTASPPAVFLFQPADEQTVQVNQFQLRGEVYTEAPLQGAALGILSPGSTMNNVLGSLIQPGGGPFGPTNIIDSLRPGVNRVRVSARNCSGEREATRFVNYAPIAAGTRFRLLGLDVVQATQDLANSVPLVAHKPTLVRAYLAVEGPTPQIFGVSADLTATRVGGEPVPPVVRSANTIVADAQGLAAKRGNIRASVNFLLPPALIAESTVHLRISQIYVDGLPVNLPCDGCENLDEFQHRRFSHFNPTRPLNLVLAPYRYMRSATPTPELLFGPAGALQWVNNVFPLRGNFPADSSGINLLRILPMQDTSRDLSLPGTGVFDILGDALFGDRGPFLFDLHLIREQLRVENEDIWPDDFSLLAMTPCNCGGRSRGLVGFVNIWSQENGPVPQDHFSEYGYVWGHELGHHFGREHSGSAHSEGAGLQDVDSGFPIRHGGIGNPGVAVTTEQWHDDWNGQAYLIPPGNPVQGQPHAHDFMSYGDRPWWVSPYTYRGLFRRLLDTAQAQAPARPARSEWLLAIGGIDRRGGAVLLPFHRLMARRGSSSGYAGAFSLELLDARGRALLSHRFEAAEDDGGGTLSFSEFVPWRRGTREIVLRGRNGVLARRAVTANAPWVRITSPREGESWGDRARVTWEAGDRDGDPLTFTLFYSAGRGAPWLPIAGGLTGNAVEIDTGLVPGSRQGRLRLRATDGVNTTTVETSRPFSVRPKPPLVAILGPMNGTIIATETPVELVGIGYDAEDGLLADRGLTWSSDRDGALGYGRRLQLRSLSAGRHVITLTACDEQGQSESARVYVEIGRVTPQ